MPVVDRQKERQIVIEGRKQGKSDQFIKDAVLRFRERGQQKPVVQEPEIQEPITQLTEGRQTGVLLGGLFGSGKGKEEAKADIGAIAEKGAETLKQRTGEFAEIVAARERGEQTALETGFQQLGTGLAFAGELAGEAAFGIGKALLPERAEEMLSGLTQRLLAQPDSQRIIQAIQFGGEQARKLEESNPRLFRNTRAFLQAGEAILEAVGIKQAKVIGREFIKATSPVPELAKKGVERVFRRAPGKLSIGARNKAAVEIIELEAKLAPPINAKETKAIILEGRVERRRSGIKQKLFGEQPDIITQSREVKQTAEVVQRLIPNANKLDNFELTNAAGREVATIATKLRPKMEAIDVSPDTFKSARNAWRDLKEAQAAETAFEAFAGTKAQKKFEVFLDKFKTSLIRDSSGRLRLKNLDDAWQIRIDYDGSIGDNIKRATDLSPSDLQFQKKMWLDNRLILNDIINDTAQGLGQTSRTAFSDMSHLYSARTNLSASTKIRTKAKPGLVGDVKRNLFKWGLWITGAAVFGKTL